MQLQKVYYKCDQRNLNLMTKTKYLNFKNNEIDEYFPNTFNIPWNMIK